MISRLHQTTMNLMLTLSLATAPLHGVINKPCYDTQCETISEASCAPNCEDHSCCLMRSNPNYWLGGAVLVSAAVGALIAAGASKKKQGHQGQRGEKGPIGPQGGPFFEVDGTITFQATIRVFTAGLPNPQGIFFITSPNGSIARSESFPIVNGQFYQSHSMTVPAIHGDYSIGLELITDPLTTSVIPNAQISLMVEPSNNSASDSKTLVGEGDFHFAASSNPQAGQLSVNYAYYPQPF